MTYRVNQHHARFPELDPFVNGTKIRMDFDCHYGDRGDEWSETHEIEIEGSMLDGLAHAVSMAASCRRLLDHTLTPMTADAIESTARELREWATEMETAAASMSRLGRESA